jgi:hypothetical protein
MNDETDSPFHEGTRREEKVELGAGTHQERNLNEVLDDIPLGWFHYRLLIMCGLAYTADAMVYHQ